MIIEMPDPQISHLTSDKVCRDRLCEEILPQFLKSRRWYSSQTDSIPLVMIEQAIPVSQLMDSSILILSVTAKGETSKSYQFPVRIMWQREAPSSGVICELRAGSACGWLVDGFSDDLFVRTLLEGMRQADGSNRDQSGLNFIRSSDFALGEIQRSGAEQSNTSVMAGDVILKAFRKIEPGIHPEIEIGEFLAEVARFEHVPKLLGSIQYSCPISCIPSALCVLQTLIPNGKDGWEYVTEVLGESSDTSAARERLLELATRVGRRTAELHRALAVDSANLAFQPEPISDEWLLRWQQGILNSVVSVVAKLSNCTILEDHTRDLAYEIVTRKGDIDDRVKELFPASTNALRTRLHGDFHLGQTIVTPDDVFIVDFEGEPMRSLAERRGKVLPLRDVAGMLRSLEYARATVSKVGDLNGTKELRLGAIIAEMQSRFLSAYSQSIAGCRSFPDSLRQADDFLELCLIEKALYEIDYEMANRPTWTAIPISGLLTVIDTRTHTWT